jgi:hypothetical protein
MARTLRGAPARPRAIMTRGVRLPRTAGRPPRFLRTGHRRATSLNEAHLQAARRDARQTLGREAEGGPSSACSIGHRGPASAKRDIPRPGRARPRRRRGLASAVGCPPPPRSLAPPRPPLSDQRGRAARRCDAAQIVRQQQPAAAPTASNRGCLHEHAVAPGRSAVSLVHLAKQAPAEVVGALSQLVPCDSEGQDRQQCCSQIGFRNRPRPRRIPAGVCRMAADLVASEHKARADVSDC